MVAWSCVMMTYKGCSKARVDTNLEIHKAWITQSDLDKISANMKIFSMLFVITISFTHYLCWWSEKKTHTFVTFHIKSRKSHFKYQQPFPLTMTISRPGAKWSGSTRFNTSSSLIPLNRSRFFLSLSMPVIFSCLMGTPSTISGPGNIPGWGPCGNPGSCFTVTGGTLALVLRARLGLVGLDVAEPGALQWCHLVLELKS